MKITHWTLEKLPSILINGGGVWRCELMSMLNSCFSEESEVRGLQFFLKARTRDFSLGYTTLNPSTVFNWDKVTFTKGVELSIQSSGGLHMLVQGSILVFSQGNLSFCPDEVLCFTESQKVSAAHGKASILWIYLAVNDDEGEDGSDGRNSPVV